MQYQTPQFIDVEDKIFVPLTVKQFFYLLGGGAIIFLIYIFFQLWVLFLLGIPVGAFALSLAFLKIDEIPFVKVLGNFLSHSTEQKIYIWKIGAQKQTPVAIEKKSPSIQTIAPKISENKLQDLAWSLDIKQNIRK